MKNNRNTALLIGSWLFTLFIAVLVLVSVVTVGRKEINISNIENSVVIVGDNNSVEISPISTSSEVLERALKILESSRNWNVDRQYHISLDDAIALSRKIESYARGYGLNLNMAFAIVDIESDFRSDVVNPKVPAYGLCQITRPCLDEYNRENNKTYTLEQMVNPNLNLDVGFWYYNRILTHYNDHYNYITEISDYTILRDAYIAYNIGVTAFNDISKQGRNEFRNGHYPKAMYGAKKGDTYEPVNRCLRKAKIWKVKGVA